MNSEKLKKDSKYEFDNLYDLFDNDDNNIKQCFYYLLFKDLIQIKDDGEYNNGNSKDFVENSNSILLHYLDNIYFKISNNQPELLPILKENIIKKNNEIKLKLKECESHIDILKKNYDNILLLEYLPITSDIKLLFENKTVLTILEPEIFNIRLSEFITRYIFSSIDKDNIDLKNVLNINKESDIYTPINIKENKINLSDKEISSVENFKENTKNTDTTRNAHEDLSKFSKMPIKENILKYIFNSKKFYSDENINSYIDNDIIVKFKFIHNNFKYWYVLITLIGQIFNKNSKYEIIFNNIEREKYINNILTPKKKNDKKKNYNKKKL